MDYNSLLEKYRALLKENQLLREEIKGLRTRLDGESAPAEREQVVCSVPEVGSVTNLSDSTKKVELFMTLFRGRPDVYAKRWENAKGAAGYSPVCGNEWKSGVCAKPRIKCSDCSHKLHLSLDEEVITEHLRGKLVAGVYPLCKDETCHFLALDFDEGEWQKDIAVLREICLEFDLPIAFERSRSGRGGHVWFFFAHPVSASLARRFGTALLTHAMSKRHEISFKSYDKLFPSQDTMPKGGLGNLIALPLQREARTRQNSVFIDEGFLPYEDQWAFLASVGKLSGTELESLIPRLCAGNELGLLRTDEGEGAEKPWEAKKVDIAREEFPDSVGIVKANMLYVPKAGFSAKALNRIKRLAAFTNPEFYKAQAMRLSTYNKPRIISCAEETSEYLCLPRGCRNDLQTLLVAAGVEVIWHDKSNPGRRIDVEFNGNLRDEQPQAIDKLLKHETGILCGTTAFGKTVVAIKLIAERGVNTLILVDKVSLVSQWREGLAKFLTINEVLPEETEGKRRGRKKKRCLIGQLGNGKNDLSGVIDIALMQSLNRKGEINDCVKDYGQIIVDECHHVSAFSFEKILAHANARYICGLTATPTRKDGHHPIIYMQCGPVRFRDNAREQAAKRPFDHCVIPRFTPLRLSVDRDERDVTITELYADIVENEARNQLIVDDVVKCYEAGRNCLVLTGRTAHVELLATKLSDKIPEVITATGGKGIKKTRETFSRIANTPTDRPLTLVATGRYIGEGFDEPRLDTLFLAMPISWKGTLQQYAGRLHRLYERKSEVQIYDYVDIHVRMLLGMYYKRLNGYGAIGYKAKGELYDAGGTDFIYDRRSFLPVYANDIISAAKEVLIVSPFISKKCVKQMLQIFGTAVRKEVRIVVVTRPVAGFLDKKRLALEQSIELLRNCGIKIVFKAKIHQKFAIVDQKIVWYGSINLLSFGSAEESVMRLESINIASELMSGLPEPSL